MAGVRVNTGSGIDPSLIEKLIDTERAPIRTLETRKSKVTEEQKLYKEMASLVSGIQTATTKFRNSADFIHLKLESSHPDIIDGTVTNEMVPGTYELEVLSTARTHKLLADAFPDKDETPVGFGYMRIELEERNSFDIDIDPEQSSLQEVANAINGAKAGARAYVMNTKEHLEDKGKDSFRLLVVSERSGKAAKVFIDPDTTYLSFKEQVTGRNLEMLFEDVPVYNEDNTAKDLIPGLILSAKRAEPGTKVTIKVDYDVDKTLENIKEFVTAYNKFNDFADKQFQFTGDNNQMGPLARDNTLRTVRRNLQSAIQYSGQGKSATLASMGITTDPKTGSLRLDETRAKAALTEDYLAVARFFVQGDSGTGFGASISDSVRALQNSQSGALSSKEREFRKILQGIDKDVASRERMIEQRADGIRRKFASLQELISGMNAQGQALQANLGTPAGPMPGLS